MSQSGGWKLATRRDVWRGMKTAHVLGLAPLLALALTACTSANSTTGTPTVASTATTTAAATGAQVTTPTTPAQPGRCVSSGLRASLGQSRGAAGTSYIALLLTNRSRVTCTLDGYPGVVVHCGYRRAPDRRARPARPPRRRRARHTRVRRDRARDS